MEIYVFDKALNFQGLLESFFSLRWIRKYSKCGDFELHCNLTPDTLNLLKKGNVIWKNDDDEAGYIEYRNLRHDIEGKEVLVVRGKFLTGYLGRRINWGQLLHNGTALDLVRKLVSENAINPTNSTRKIPRMVLDGTVIFTEDISYQNSYGNVLEEIEKVSLATEIGYRTVFDYENKSLIFEIYKGLDRTAGNGINPPAIFSQEFENVLEQEYTDSMNNYRNTVLVAGEGEGSDRELVSIENGQGLDRYEMFVDAKDLQSKDENDNTIPLAEYRQLLEDRGISKLSEHKEIQTFESKVNVNSNLVYKEDFDLGDIVTCTSKKWGITIDTRITEIEEVYEASGKQINVTFGNEIPTLIDKIRQVVN